MKMTDVDARLAELESRRMSGLTVAEQNELRDCEIALGMVECSAGTRAEAARRVERFAEDMIDDEKVVVFRSVPASKVRKGQVIHVPILGRSVTVTKREKWNSKDVKISFVEKNGMPSSEFFALLEMLEVVV